MEGQVGHGTWNTQAGLLPLGPDPLSRRPTAWDPALHANDRTEQSPKQIMVPKRNVIGQPTPPDGSLTETAHRQDRPLHRPRMCPPDPTSEVKPR